MIYDINNNFINNYYHKLDNNSINKECFICLDINDNIYFIQLNKMRGYDKKCTCCSWVHELCLNKWYEKKNVCPICREIVTKQIPFMKKIYNNITLSTHNNRTIRFMYHAICNAIYTIIVFLLFIIAFDIYVYTIDKYFTDHSDINTGNNHNNSNYNNYIINNSEITYI